MESLCLTNYFHPSYMLRVCRTLGFKADAVMSELQYLVEKKGGNIYSVSWKQFFNSLDAKTVKNLSCFQLSEILSHVCKFPNFERFHDVLDIMGNRILTAAHAGLIHPDVATSIARAYLEAGLHVASPECMRYRKNQLRVVRDTTREIIPKLVSCGSGANAAYVAALAVRQGYVAKDEMDLGSIFEQNFPALPDSLITLRAELAWALSVLSPQDTRKEILKLFTFQDVQMFAYNSNMPSMSVIPRSEWFRIVQLLDATKGGCTRTAETVDDCLSDKATVCGTIASNSLWWRAVSAGTFDRVTAQCMRVCMDKVDYMSEDEKWKARNSLMHFGTLPIADKELANQLAYCNRNDILGRPKRAAVAWRHVGGSRNSSSVHS
jgi:hypothetical protein